MKDLPLGLDESAMVALVTDSWGIKVSSSSYVPKGFGSYHWAVGDAGGGQYFITVDDLAQKPYLGSTPPAAFEGLRAAFDTAYALRHEVGLEFVVAPVLSRKGETVQRLTDRYTVAVFPRAEGAGGSFGERGSSAERAQLILALVRLHQATPAVKSVARVGNIALPDRVELERALQDLDRKWAGGPFSEPAGAWLSANGELVAEMLESFDRLVDRVKAKGASHVITHGEPHGGNTLRTDQGISLIDWDTAGLALPERDLWMIGADNELELYAELSGRAVDSRAVDLYRTRWVLDDIASFVSELRAPHERTADTAHALLSLERALDRYSALTG